MAAVAFPPKGPRSNAKNYGRPLRSGSQTWGPGTQHIYSSHGHILPTPYMPAQAVFYPPQTKQDYTYSTNHGYVTPTCSGLDSPPSTDGSVQGSPRSFSHNAIITSPSFDLVPEDAISAVSSPGEEFHGYFSDHGRERQSFSMEAGASNHHSASQYAISGAQSNASSLYTGATNRSRQGSIAGFSVQQHGPSEQRVQHKSEETPVSPTHRTRLSKQQRNQRRGGSAGQQKMEFYTIAADLPEEVQDDSDGEEPTMLTTLNARIQLSICKEVDEVLRSCLFWWLVTYKFEIARNPRARDIETADDRDYEGFCSVVNDLTARRSVPREAVHHERIAELNTVLAGPSEIRHMLAHPERHLKSDWRMLGLIAAAIEVCKILQYRKGHRQLFKLYQTTEARIIALKAERQQKLESTMAEMSISGTSSPKETECTSKRLK
ncbi:hypothetical protein BDZ91DRAFT_456111 [Kalaharituber pfeilii]|nr:hypothetical protein BDZ91DRAFT_456111 [Kalaharituber pfeilii]